MSDRPGVRELTVTPSTSLPGATTSDVRAVAYTDLVGTPERGDDVLVNVSALARGLGTGGFALVVALPDRLPADPPDGPGHLVKARYTPMQTMVLGVDDQESPHHDALAAADSLDGMPVVVADLHSALPAIVAGIRLVDPSLVVAYVMTDGGALPARFSATAAGLTESGWIAGTVSVGQSFGGDIEAVSLHTGLLAAKSVLRADIAIVAQGPGNLGTGTKWGFSGVSAGEAVNAASVLHGRPIGSLRVSEADERHRHFGVSHHSLTAYGQVALAPAEIAVPELPGKFGADVRRQAAALGAPRGRHVLVNVPADGLDDALAGCPVPLRTMGRGPGDDRAAFVSAAAAGRYAANARP
nr:DUF3866 family protein [Spelaeicoccus albus]